MAGISAYFLLSDADGYLDLQDRSLHRSASNPNPLTDSTPINLEEVASETVLDKRGQSIKDLVSLKSDFDRSMSIHLLIANASKDTLDTYIRQSVELPSTKQRNLALSIIFRRFSALDPQLALDRFLLLDRLTFEQEFDLLGSIFDEWMERDYTGAVIAINALPQEDRELAASVVMSRSDDLPLQQRMELARQIGPNDLWIEFRVNSIRLESYKEDPRGAFYERLGEKSRAQVKISDLSSISEYWFEIEGISVIPEISESVRNTEMRRHVLNYLIARIVGDKKADPSAILNVVMDLPDKRDARRATESTLNNWAGWNPQQSFETSLKYDDELITREIRSSLLMTWARQDPEGLFAKASSFPTEYRNIAVVEALGQLAKDDPQEAIGLANDLDTPVMKAAAKGEILRYWSMDDAKSAVEWFVSDTVDENVEEHTAELASAFQSYMNQDFESALNYANHFEGKLRSWFVQSIANHLVRSDLERAIEYLTNVKEASSDWIQSKIGYELVRLDPRRALAFGETIEANHRARYYEQMLYSWADYDLMALHRNIQKVPNEFRGVAAKALLIENDMKHFLSEGEIQELESILQM